MTKEETLIQVPSGPTYSPGGPGDEDDGENEPEHVAEDDHLHHVQVRPARRKRQRSDRKTD